MVETFNSRDKKLLLLEKFSEDYEPLKLKYGGISNKEIENEDIGKGVEASEKKVLILIYYPSGLSRSRMIKTLTQNSCLMLTIDSSSAINHSEFHESEVQYEVFNT